MKRTILSMFAILLYLTGFSQRYEVNTAFNNTNFKRHFTHTIEGGFIDNLPRQFVVGNGTDYLMSLNGAKLIQGNSINGTTFKIPGKNSYFQDSPDLRKFLLTDIVVPSQGGDAQQGYGCGIYYPQGENSWAFPFFATIDKKTMAIINIVYYNLSYPGVVTPTNAGATRIKYSAKENAFYISGVMVDRVFVDMNFNEIQGRSKGFIMKVNPLSALAQVFVVNPDNVPEGKAQICSINDLEINIDESLIYFTGVTAEDQFAGYIHPMAGAIDMNLNYQWCLSYEMQGSRYSGVDIELGDHESSLFVLMNSSDYPFSIMELDLRGNILQQPESYTFTGKTCGSVSEFLGAAKGHIMHYTESNGLKITGNVFIQNEHDISQRLFSYDIPTASNLRAGNPRFGTYSCDPIPLGNQPAVTSWWAPENSLYSNGNLSIVGFCNYNASWVGYVYVNTAGFNFADPNCYYEGTVSIKDLSTHQSDQLSYISQCDKIAFSLDVNDWYYSPIENCSPGEGKSSLIEENTDNTFWEYAGIDETGIHGYINSEEEAQYQINVYDLTGRKVCSETYNVKGQKYVHLKFATNNQLYLINVSNGTQSETIKVSGVK